MVDVGTGGEVVLREMNVGVLWWRKDASGRCAAGKSRRRKVENWRRRRAADEGRFGLRDVEECIEVKRGVEEGVANVVPVRK